MIVGARLQCPLVARASARARRSSPPTSSRSCRDPRGSSSSRTASSSSSRPRASQLLDLDGAADRARRRDDVTWDEAAAEKGGYETFMLKEIHEQPEAMRETIGERLDGGARRARHRASPTSSCWRSTASSITACGTAYHAGLVGRYLIEEWARLPVDIDVRLGVPLPQPGARRAHARDRRSRSRARPPTRSPPSASHATAARARSRSAT